VTTLLILERVSRALGLAQALAHPIGSEVREGSTEEIGQEIVNLLEPVRDELLAFKEWFETTEQGE
jgi:hypothetical protein